MVRTRTPPRSSVSNSDIFLPCTRMCVVRLSFSITKPGQAFDSRLELGDQLPHEFGRGQEFVDQADALTDFHLALVDVAIECRHFQGSASAQRRQLLCRRPGPFSGLELTREIVLENAAR